MKNTLTSPQVVAAIITSIVGVLVAILPAVINNANMPLPTPTVANASVSTSQGSAIDPTATLIVKIIATDTPMIVPPTIEQATSVPTISPTPILPTDSPPANVLLLYDDVSFTIHNQSGQVLSISKLRFESSSGSWDAERWGTSLAGKFLVNNCLRLRDAASGQRQPPATCGDLLGLQLISGNSLFWLNTTEFDVLYDEMVIATCSTTATNCPIYLSP